MASVVIRAAKFPRNTIRGKQVFALSTCYIWTCVLPTLSTVCMAWPTHSMGFILTWWAFPILLGNLPRKALSTNIAKGTKSTYINKTLHTHFPRISFPRNHTLHKHHLPNLLPSHKTQIHMDLIETSTLYTPIVPTVPTSLLNLHKWWRALTHTIFYHRRIQTGPSNTFPLWIHDISFFASTFLHANRPSSLNTLCRCFISLTNITRILILHKIHILITWWAYEKGCHIDKNH